MADGQDGSTNLAQDAAAVPGVTAYPPQGAPPPGVNGTTPLNTAPYPPQTQATCPAPNTTPYPPGQQDPSYPPPGAAPNSSEAPPPYPGQPTNYPYQQGYAQQSAAVGVVPPGKYDPSLQAQIQPPQQPVQVDAGSQPETYLIASILSLFCCLIFGIIAVVYSSQVSSLWAQGRHSEARRASSSAKGWAIAAFVVGCIVIVGNIIRVIALTATY